jgi:hypothetical protein
MRLHEAPLDLGEERVGHLGSGERRADGGPITLTDRAR